MQEPAGVELRVSEQHGSTSSCRDLRWTSSRRHPEARVTTRMVNLKLRALTFSRAGGETNLRSMTQQGEGRGLHLVIFSSRASWLSLGPTMERQLRRCYDLSLAMTSSQRRHSAALPRLARLPRVTRKACAESRSYPPIDFSQRDLQARSREGAVAS